MEQITTKGISAITEKKCIENIVGNLNGIHNDSKKVKTLTFDINRDKIIVFSDHHRGKGNGKDDFKRSSKIYEQAMRKYLKEGYTLILLGDVEELWEVHKPGKIIKQYNRIYYYENKFIQKGRYYRCFGNHDVIWEDEDTRAKFYSKMKLSGAPTFEGYKINFKDGGSDINTFLLVHGHQGTYNSEVLNKIKEFGVRVFYAPIQNLIKWHLNNSPAKNKHLGETVAKGMATWSKTNGIPILFGHTHEAIFKGKYYSQPKNVLKDEYEGVFNTGCCSYKNGSIVGIEFTQGNIELIEWERKGKNIKDWKKRVHKTAKLSEVS